ncbi:hypothetical protein D3H64_02660 [Atopobacter sp. AH10]|nr:hypothetical protein D3H64_02660 [Atopobacter sp. AH10]
MKEKSKELLIDPIKKRRTFWIESKDLVSNSIKKEPKGLVIIYRILGLFVLLYIGFPHARGF